jgi:hypothetical protein
LHGRAIHAISINIMRALIAMAATLTCSAGVAASEPTAREEVTRPHALYVELLGKGALWGLGYDYQVHEAFALGATASFYMLKEQRVFSLSPYLAGYPVWHGHHRWFVQGGPQIVHQKIDSPVPEWSGRSWTALCGEVATGYEYRNIWLLRAYGMLTLGAGGVAPWAGLSMGRTLP